MAQPERGLALIGARAEHVEPELEVDRRRVITRWNYALHAEAALLDTDARLPGAAELSFRGGDLRWTKRVHPVGVDTLGVLNVVHLGETIDLEVAACLRCPRPVPCGCAEDGDHHQRRRSDNFHTAPFPRETRVRIPIGPRYRRGCRHAVITRCHSWRSPGAARRRSTRLGLSCEKSPRNPAASPRSDRPDRRA